jgi:hypothetical protein
VSERLSWIRSILSTTPERWILLAETVPPELMWAVPKEGEWSAVECLQHLLDAERVVFPFRAKRLLEGLDFPAYDPDREGTKLEAEASPAAMAQGFRQMRADSLQLLSGIEEVALERRGKHPELGEVSLGELLNEWAAHDLVHTMQAERAMMQPFLQRVGPWRKFFQEHLFEPG